MAELNFGLHPDTLKEIYQDIEDLRVCGLSDDDIGEVIGQASKLSNVAQLDFIGQFQLMVSLIRVDYPQRFLLTDNTGYEAAMKGTHTYKFYALRESVKGCFITAVEPLVMPIIRLLQRLGF